MTKKLFSKRFSKQALVPAHVAVFFALTSVGFISTASAQTAITAGQAGVQRVFANNFYGVGFGASFVSGMGLTLKDHFAYSPVSFVVTGMPFKIGDFEMYNIGGELQYDLYLAETRLYLIAGAGYYYYNDGSGTTGNSRGVSNANSSNSGLFTNTTTTSSNELSSPFRVGFGLGYEMPFGRNVGMSLNMTFTAFMPSGDIIPTPSIGFIGYFR